jgi:hypothetical protein
MTTSIIVARLHEYIEPEWLFGVTLEELVTGADPLPDYKETAEERDEAYDRGRIAFFRDQFLEGVKVTPLQLDCQCSGGRVYALPVMIDGWHRFSAALLAKIERVDVQFSGRVDLLRYLQGRRKTKPPE